MIWYGQCTYWTDSKIDRCPVCGRRTFSATESQWFDVPPEYYRFLLLVRERCYGELGLVDAYYLWLGGKLKI